MSRIHATAIVGSSVELGDGVEIGAFTIIETATRIGAGTVIGSHCHLGVKTPLTADEPLEIGSQSHIRSHSVFYAGSSFGAQLTTGHGVIAREATRAGVNLQLGTGCDVQGHCMIGDYVRLHSHAQVNHGSRLGDFVWLFPYVVLTNDPTPPSDELAGVSVEEYAAVGARAVILPGVTIGRGALVGAGSVVRATVPADALVIGNPAQLRGNLAGIRLKESGRLAYPWRRHFHRGYPSSIVAAWRAEFPEG